MVLDCQPLFYIKYTFAFIAVIKLNNKNYLIENSVFMIKSVTIIKTSSEKVKINIIAKIKDKI